MRARRYTYYSCLSFGTDGEADYCELDAMVSFIVHPGRPETPPAYDHGGLPAEGPEIDDIRVEMINDKAVTSGDRLTCEAIICALESEEFYADMLASSKYDDSEGK